MDNFRPLERFTVFKNFLDVYNRRAEINIDLFKTICNEKALMSLDDKGMTTFLESVLRYIWVRIMTPEDNQVAAALYGKEISCSLINILKNGQDELRPRAYERALFKTWGALFQRLDASEQPINVFGSVYNYFKAYFKMRKL